MSKNQPPKVNYRVWDQENREMIESPTRYVLDADGTLFYRTHKAGVKYSLAPALEATPLLFTGLKDAKGNRIFEADILKSSYLWVVKRTPGGYTITAGPDNTMNDKPLLHFWREAEVSEVGLQVEVVGNKYQDLELLKN